ncbi:AAA family ATPase [Streptomyces sp. NPDC002248]
MATKDYSKIAQNKIVRAGDVKRQPKFLIYSRNKKGKTWFSTTAGPDKTLVLDPEHGTDEMGQRRPHVWHIEKWEDMDEAFQYLRSGDHPYGWVAVDGLTKISNMALHYVMKVAEQTSLDRQPGMVQQRDYGKAGELMKIMLSGFYNLHTLGVVFTSQERMIEGTDSEDDEEAEQAAAMYVPDLPKGVRASVNSIVDVIGRLYVVRVEKGEGTVPQRRLWIGESTKYDTGYRSDFPLPDYVRAPTIPKLVSLIRTGKVPTRPKR